MIFGRKSLSVRCLGEFLFFLAYVTMLYESGIDPLVAMRIVGHADYQTTANIYTHLKDETLRRAYISMEKVFGENQA